MKKFILLFLITVSTVFCSEEQPSNLNLNLKESDSFNQEYVIQADVNFPNVKINTIFKGKIHYVVESVTAEESVLLAVPYELESDTSLGDDHVQMKSKKEENKGESKQNAMKVYFANRGNVIKIENSEAFIKEMEKLLAIAFFQKNGITAHVKDIHEMANKLSSMFIKAISGFSAYCPNIPVLEGTDWNATTYMGDFQNPVQEFIPLPKLNPNSQISVSAKCTEKKQGNVRIELHEENEEGSPFQIIMDSNFLIDETSGWLNEGDVDFQANMNGPKLSASVRAKISSKKI